MDKYLRANVVLSRFCHGYMSLRKELPIRPSEMGVLNIIVLRDGQYTPVMIAELLDVSKSMITAHITALEKNGYIERECSKDDKRSFYVIPTDKARELVKSSSEKIIRCLHQIESSLSGEAFETLLNIVDDANEILANMKDDNI